MQKVLIKERFKKTAEATEDLTGNKIADKTTSVGKTKSKEKEISKTRNLHTIRKKGIKLLMT